MCRSRLWLLYWVSTQIRRQPALTRLESAKSISRYRPPNGTAGLARSAVSGASRLPAPPASTIPRTRRCVTSDLLGASNLPGLVRLHHHLAIGEPAVLWPPRCQVFPDLDRFVTS